MVSIDKAMLISDGTCSEGMWKPIAVRIFLCCKFGKDEVISFT